MEVGDTMIVEYTLATMSRPQGYSQSHWRKVYRTMKPIDITVTA